MQSMQTAISLVGGYNYKGVVSPQDTYNAKMTLPRNITTRNTILKSARKLIP